MGYLKVCCDILFIVVGNKLLSFKFMNVGLLKVDNPFHCSRRIIISKFMNRGLLKEPSSTEDFSKSHIFFIF